MPRPITDTLRLLHGGVFFDNCSDLFAGVGIEGARPPGKADPAVGAGAGTPRFLQRYADLTVGQPA